MSFFPDVPKIKYEGPDSTNPLAYRHYNPDEIVEGKSMRDHLRFAVSYWHTFRGTGSDPFGPGCAVRPWEDGTDSPEMALKRVDVAFEFMEKLGVPYYCFHDRDIAPEGANLTETNKILDSVVKKLKEAQGRTGIKLLWGTANLFSNKRFVHGASTSCNADVFAYSAAQVKKALEVTKELGGENYVFWGGREGYMTLWNTDLKRELDHLAKFFHMAVEYKKKIGFTGPFLIEPKPHEPTSHQYDFDCAHSLAFLRANGLEKEFKFNVETNHATLARHTMGHELEYASMNGMLGSIDANRGDALLGWDTDQFPTDLYVTAQVMLVVLNQGGIGAGGMNFDAKVRRDSFEPVDLFHAHIGGMDAFAHGLKIAAAIRRDGALKDIVKQRYLSWDTSIGADIEGGKVKFEELEAYMLKKGDVTPNVSGRQELIENVLNRYLR
ncbi:xylose isomerase : Xylose isomerase OS=Blastopirellula marina DSM 3645 GN=xylA PE=3 SV=1: AP_endonuc_2 [Gemmata massiliana]|uniref:Xylose isomerase n=1 Tax=Gemmata massiliana TaxID=1210884 RepID=A0A6P2DIE3_9BACT|nr:xylose isomerase [Gemmata massiliana]VTS01929.1 xylose isomerase : Xylose isomerase OS=Blastopirellula marina DSM 3645 GN=xylA PE=3 SV=1: AP_endonuc_2 [Gemmata massiliana]